MTRPRTLWEGHLVGSFAVRAIERLERNPSHPDDFPHGSAYVVLAASTAETTSIEAQLQGPDVAALRGMLATAQKVCDRRNVEIDSERAQHERRRRRERRRSAR